MWPRQFNIADHCGRPSGSFETDAGAPVLINLLVLIETEWVLRSRYSLTKSDIAAKRCWQGSVNFD